MVILFSFINESFPPKTKFNVEDIPDLTGRVMIVTGANAGQYAFLSFHGGHLNNVSIHKALEKRQPRYVKGSINHPKRSHLNAYNTSIISGLAGTLGP